jgi:hypothetical protein
MNRVLPALLLAAALAAADTVVLRDRTILEGGVTKGDKGLEAGGRTVPLEEVLLWENDRGEAQHAPSFEAHLDGCAAIAERELLAECRKRFPEMLAAGAVGAARDTLVRAVVAGLPPKEAAQWESSLLKGEEKEGAPGAAPGREVLATLLARRAKATLERGDEHQYRGWQLLLAALRRDRDNKDAIALLEEIAPATFRLGHYKEENKDPYRVQRLWLDWQVNVLRGEVRPIGRTHPDMERARATWGRTDLNGVETREEGAEIVFITPLNDRTELLGKCVRYAKITCRALAKMFHTDEPRRDDTDPLVIYFYETRDEYVNYAGRPNPFLAMTAGFYTPGENISRFFWPDRVDATNAVRDTFVHELTHHWIERRNPRWHASDMPAWSPEPKPGDSRTEVPGYWICEGFATFIEEGRYDIDNYTWSHFNPRANSLNVVAALSRDKGQKLIAWDKAYGMTQAAFHGDGLDKKGIFTTARKKWGLTPQPFVEIRLFYEQSAATCHYLYWAEEGKYRARLLDYVTSFYTCKLDKTGIETAFGLAPKDLGARVEEFARKVVDGWRPPGQ